MRRARVGVVLGIVLVLASVIAWRCTARRTSDTRARDATSADHATGGPAGARGEASAARDGRPLPAWLAYRGLPARRIAGHVVRDGAPAADATVTLHTPLAAAGLGDPEVQTTGADGAFDFGALPAATYTVTAAAEGATGAIEYVDTSDPTRAPPADRLVLRLTACAASVEGVVVDAVGNPVPHARVVRSGVSSLGTETDARGAYKLCVPFGDVPIDYAADGYGAVTLHLDVRGQTQRNVVLVPEATLAVRVVRATDDAPVPDARVIVDPKEWAKERPATHVAVTDADGRARIEGLVPARYLVVATSDTMLAETAAEALAEVGRDTEVVVRLSPAALIRGRVVSGAAPIAGARIYAVRTSPPSRTPEAFTQADGAFELPRVPPGDVAFEVRGYEVDSPTRITVAGGAQVDDVVVQVHAMGSIRGRVTRLGEPAPDVDVCCVRSADPGMTARTDADGHYAFVGVPPGRYDLSGGADAIGAFALPRKITLAEGEIRDVDIELDQAGTIAGTVVDRAGTPVRGVFVRWIHEQTSDVCRALTDAQGRYRCGAMTGGGRYRAAVFPSQDLQQVPYPTADGGPYPTIEVKDGTTLIEDVVLAIDRPDLAIEGHVVDETGGAIADATVRATPAAPGQTPSFAPWRALPSTSTTEDGGFRITALAPGTYALQARATDGAEGVAPAIAAGSTSAVIRIERPGTIDGTLVGFAQPPTIYARGVGPGMSTASIAGTGDAKQFRITGLRAGRYVVNANTGAEGDAREVDVTAGAVARVTLTSHGSGAIDGTVLDFRTRAPLPNVVCRAVMGVDGESAPTRFVAGAQPTSDARGRVTIEPAPAGSLVVECLQPDALRSAPSATVTLAAGSRASVELLAVERSQDNASSIGAGFDWRTVPPRISAIAPNSPAARAGLLAGDLVTAVDGVSVQGLNGSGVATLLASTPVGATVRITVQRGGATQTFAVIARAD